MFAISLRQCLSRDPRVYLNVMKRGLSVKFLRDKQMNYELKLKSIQELVLQKNIETNGDIDWKEMISHLSEQRLVFKQNFEKDLMSAFLLNDGKDSDKVDQKLFQSFVQMMKTLPNISTNTIGLSRYCHFISHFKGYIDENDIQLIRQTTDQLMDKYFDNKITHELIVECMIALTKSSKDNCLHSLKLLDKMTKIDSRITQNIMQSTLEFKLFDEFLDLLMRFSNFRLNDEMIDKIIESLIELNPSFDKTINLLKNFSQNLVIFGSKTDKNIIEIMKRFDYKTNKTLITRNGLCLKCNQSLNSLSHEEYETLVKQFRNVIFNKDNDLLMSTFPEYEKELKNFEKFMRKITARKPLDLVIDGLNVAFATHADVFEDPKSLRGYIQKHRKETIDRNVIQLIEMNGVLDKYHNILIIGRRHMKNWKLLSHMLVTQRERISMFYTMDKTQDDCYVLWASLQNPNTYLISSDFYRDYSDKMAKELLFQRWLTTHQIQIENRKDFILPDIFDHKIHISSDNQIIHIPFRNSENSRLDWICCQK